MAYKDDASIQDETRLFRRIIVEPNLWIVWDANLGRWRPTSAAFDDHRNGSPMSVVVEDTLLASGRTTRDALGEHSNMALAAITAGVARVHGLGVAREPTKEEPAHGVVFGRKTKKVRSALAKAAAWAVPPAL